MINPYADLGRAPEDVRGEEVSGTFDCQTNGCYSYAKEARYLAKDKILTWICKESQHISKIEDFHL